MFEQTQWKNVQDKESYVKFHLKINFHDNRRRKIVLTGVWSLWKNVRPITFSRPAIVFWLLKKKKKTLSYRLTSLEILVFFFSQAMIYRRFQNYYYSTILFHDPSISTRTLPFSTDGFVFLSISIITFLIIFLLQKCINQKKKW